MKDIFFHPGEGLPRICLQPDIILAGGGATIALQRETRTIPIVFVTGGGPVASGIIPQLDHPSGNIPCRFVNSITFTAIYMKYHAPGQRRVSSAPIACGSSKGDYSPSAEPACQTRSGPFAVATNGHQQTAT